MKIIIAATLLIMPTFGYADKDFYIEKFIDSDGKKYVISVETDEHKARMKKEAQEEYRNRVKATAKFQDDVAKQRRVK